MSFTASYVSGINPTAIFYEFAKNADTIATLSVMLVVFVIVVALIRAILLPLGNPKTNEEEIVEEFPERNEYKATIECNNCKHEQKIPIVKGYDIEEAIKLGDYFCKTCGSRSLKRKKAYWE